MEAQNSTPNNKNIVFIDDPQNYLAALKEEVPFTSYQELGITLKSLCNLCQTALLNHLENPNWVDHNLWDIYNTLKLVNQLYP